MSLPRKFMAARMTNSTPGDLIDNNTGADVVDTGGLGSLESAICDVFGFTIDSNITASAFSLNNSGQITKDQLRQIAAGPVGLRMRDSTANTEMRMVVEGSLLKFDQNTGTEGTPVWVTRFSINLSTGALTGTAFSSTSAGLAPASDLDSTKYLSADGTYTVPASSATATSCKLGHNTTQSIPHNTFTALSFNTERWDSNSMHDPGAPTKITFPVAGKYLVMANAAFGANTTGRRLLDLVQGSAGIVNRSDVDALASGSTIVYVAAVVNASASDYIEVKAYQTSGVSLNIASSPAFSAYRIGG